MADIALEDIPTTLAKFKEFMNSAFSISADGADNGLTSPPRKAALRMWTTYCDRSVINVPGSIVQWLLPLTRQCEVIDAETLKSIRLHLCSQVESLKKEI